jgi:hypothetical protein
MHADRRPTPQADDEKAETVVMDLLLTPSANLWTIDELGREIGGTNLAGKLAAVDAVARLQAAGLLHSYGEFVVPTRAAVRAAELRR